MDQPPRRKEVDSRTSSGMQLSSVSMHSTGQIREGFEDLTFERVDRRAQCVFHDISDVLGEQLVLLLSEQHWEHVVQSIYVRFN